MSKFIIETVEVVHRTYAVEADNQDHATDVFYDELPDPINVESSSEDMSEIYERKVA